MRSNAGKEEEIARLKEENEKLSEKCENFGKENSMYRE